jgi:hypothetical protein
LVHQDLGTHVRTGNNRVIEGAFETFLFAYDAVQKVRAIDLRGLQNTNISKWTTKKAKKKHANRRFVEIDLYHRLDRVPDMYRLEELQ